MSRVVNKYFVCSYNVSEDFRYWLALFRLCY